MKRVRIGRFNRNHLLAIPQIRSLSADIRFDMEVVSAILPFRVNKYVIDSLIDWDNLPDDPIFKLTFPQRGMLEPHQFERLAILIRSKARQDLIDGAVKEIRSELNPDPAQQKDLNVPFHRGASMSGIQHRYPDTVLVFPSHGQTCHAYCTFCFRWSQFVNNKQSRFSTSSYHQTLEYLETHLEVSDVLFTGGDPLIMGVERLKDYLYPLLENRYEHIRSIRIGTKALSFWPKRFICDRDSDDLLRLFEKITRTGKHLSIMAHFDHPRELEPPVAKEAIRRVRDTGALIRSQAPVLRGINDTADIWARLWRAHLQIGITPYYMFIERDTGARRFFEVPIAKAYDIYREAFSRVPGLARTARGPVMSTGPGKILVQGVAEIAGKLAFILSFIQARSREWVGKPFLSRFDPDATWFSVLRPFDVDKFFFEDEYKNIVAVNRAQALSLLTPQNE